MAPVAAALIYLTMGEMADYLFGAGDPQQAQTLLGRLFQAGANRFSYQYTEVAGMSGEVAGLVISYSGRLMRALEMPMAFQMLRLTGIPGLVRFVRRASPLVGVREAEDDEYFISNIAVLPMHQGKGLGRNLLYLTEDKARRQGFSKLSLTVEVENERARSLYARMGFDVIQTVEIEALRRQFGYAGFHRMVKPIT